MLSNAYFLAKFRFDTAENEPAKNLQNFARILLILLTLTPNLRSNEKSEHIWGYGGSLFADGDYDDEDREVSPLSLV